MGRRKCTTRRFSYEGTWCSDDRTPAVSIVYCFKRGTAASNTRAHECSNKQGSNSGQLSLQIKHQLTKTLSFLR
jgi:hypothetical protein